MPIQAAAEIEILLVAGHRITSASRVGRILAVRYAPEMRIAAHAMRLLQSGRVHRIGRGRGRGLIGRVRVIVRPASVPRLDDPQTAG